MVLAIMHVSIVVRSNAFWLCVCFLFAFRMFLKRQVFAFAVFTMRIFHSICLVQYPGVQTVKVNTTVLLH